MATLEGFRLSPQQQRLHDSKKWIHVKIQCKGSLDESRLRSALTELIARHELLRTRFETTPGSSEVLQVIHPQTLPFYTEAIHEDHAYSALIQNSEGAELVLHLPAACVDEASLSILLDELAALYRGETSEEPLQYADLAEWLNDQQEEEKPELTRRGDAALSGALPFARHQILVDSETAFSHHSATVAFDAPEEVTWTAAAWALFLWRYTRQSALTIFTGFTNRDYEGMESLIGPLQNPLPLSLRLRGDMSHADLVMDWRAEVGRLEPHQELALSGHARFAFSRQPALFGQAGDLDLAMSEYPDLFPLTFDLHLIVRDDGVVLQSDARRFSAGQTEALAQAFGHLLRSLPGREQDAIETLPLTEQQGVQSDPPAQAPLWSTRIAETLSAYPDQAIVQDSEAAMTGAQFNEAVQRLTAALRAHDIGVGDVVPVMLERSRFAVIAMLAIHQTGAAWLPMEGVMPPERLVYVLEDAGARVVVSEAPPEGVSLPVLQPSQLPALDETPAYAPTASQDDLAYLIYTSGSTGRPKGVLISNRALSAYLDAVIKTLDLPADAAYAHVSTLAADLGHTVLFPPLMSGGLLHLIDGSVIRDGEALAGYFEAHAIDVLKIVPGQLAALMSCERPERLVPHQRLIFGGERLPVALIERVRRLNPDCRVFNHYGPSEATVGVLARSVDEIRDEDPPLGRPMGHALVHIREESGLIAPHGMVGELMIGGPTLADGYRNLPDQTAAVFLETPQGRRYASGDLAFQDVDAQGCSGDVVFLGRGDGQVKIRGFRVEISEVEHCLRQVTGVREALVQTVGEGEHRRLRGWAVLAANVDPDDVLRKLGGFLPEPMMPDRLITVPEFPRTPNGKIDRKRLPQGDAAVTATQFRNEREAAMGALWREFFKTAQLGPDSDFFQLGGSSLTATVLLNRIRKTFPVDLSIQEMFAHATIGGLADLVAAKAGVAQRQPITPAPADALRPLSHAQQRLWVLDRLNPGSTAYNLPAAFEVTGDFDLDRFGLALNRVVSRHEALRSRFLMREGVPIQEGLAEVDVSPQLLDLSEDAQADTRQLEQLEQWRNQAFDLDAPVTPRCLIIRRAADRHVILVNLHHITTDAWSREILISDLNRFYRDPDANVPALPIQYGDYAYADRHTDYSQGLSWWRDHLNAMPDLDLPTDRPRRPRHHARAERISLTFEDEHAVHIKRAADALQLTPFMTLMFAFQILLSRHTGQRDFGIGFPVANRDQPELEGLIGFFVNTLVLRTALIDEEEPLTMSEGARRLRRNVLQALDHANTPFEALVETLDARRDTTRTPLFQVMFLYRDTPGGEPRLGDHTLNLLDTHNPHAKCDLTLEVEHDGQGFAGYLEYDADLFDGATIQVLADHYLRLLGTLDPADLVARQTLADPMQLLTTWREHNQTERAIQSGRTLVSRFEDMVDTHPDRTALICGEEQLTYAQLDRRANAVAQRLLDAGLAMEDRVGLDTTRTSALLIRLLGILKAGGVYVPLDPKLPTARLDHMRQTAQPRFSLGDLPEALDHDPTTEAERSSHPIVAEQLAYVLFTSGSTGKPKGVAVSHHAMVNFLDSMTRDPGISVDDRLAAVTPLTFDISGLELLGPLGVGAAVVLLDQTITQDAGRLAEALQSATLMQATPATWRMLLDGGWKPHQGLRMLCGGEALPASLAADLTREGGVVTNLYGPTETTVWSSLAPIDGSDIHLGAPIDNTQFAVVDPVGNLALNGGVGELLIGGAGLARGYLGDPAKTAAAFVPDPFSGHKGARLYRTGDLVRRRHDGRLLFLGRRDHQLKVRGFRIEADEVRTHLERIEAIGASAVIAKNDRLIAFVQPAPGHTIDPANFETWRRQLRAELPEYMAPGVFVALAELPRNANGKWDVRALHAMNIQDQRISRPPQSEREHQMIDLWREALDVTSIGMDDSFFQLGGHSLSAIRLAGTIGETFGVELDLRAFFEQPTPTDALMQVDRGRRREVIPAATAPFRPSRAQQRLWVLERMGRDGAGYAMGGGLRFTGALNVTALEDALRLLTDRHELLRARLSVQDDVPYLSFTDHAPALIQRNFDDDPDTLDQQVTDWLYQPYDLTEDALFRTALWRLDEDQHVLLLAAHHLIADDASMAVFTHELTRSYDALTQGQTPEHRTLPIRYVDYAAWQWTRDYTDGLDYWRERLRGLQDVALPTDFDQPAGPRRGARRPIHIGPEVSAWIRQNRHTAFTVLLSAYQWLLGRYADSDRVQVGVSVAGRERAELEGLIGLFVNTLVMRADLSGTFETFLDDNSRHVRDALAHGDVPFELIQGAAATARDTPLFRAFFVLHSALDDAEPTLADPDLNAAWRTWDSPGARFDLSLSLQEAGHGYSGFFHYDANQFAPDTIHAFACAYLTLLRRLCLNERLPLDRLPFAATPITATSITAKTQPLGKDGYTGDVGLMARFQEHAKGAPDAPCLRGLTDTYSYREVDCWSDDLAARLDGVGVEDVVAVMAARTPATVVAMLAILKRGGVFLPIDPDLPRARIEMMLRDADTRYFIAAEDPDLGIPWLNSKQPQQPAAFLPVSVLESATAYLIYTSGSTGRPKPVAVTHENLNRYRAGLAAQLEPQTGWRYALISSLSADLGNTVLFLSLAHGGCLHVIAQSLILDAEATAQTFVDHPVDVLKITPSHYRALLQSSDPMALVPHRWLVLGGEALDIDTVRQVKTLRPACRVLNHYGPSETTVGVTRCELDGQDRITIGTGFPSVQTYVVDAHLQRLPTGAVGELVIGGGQVTRGYRGRPAHTAERFVPDPFGPYGGRLYRTGDRVRKRGLGDLIFLGRVDDQVKIRGHRVEPGEVAQQLRQIDGVRDAAVLAVDGALWAFIAGEAEPATLEITLRERLPNPMIPSYWRTLDALPRNANGKLDRKALLADIEANPLEAHLLEANPQADAHETDQAGETIKLDAAQSRMAELWSDLLRLNRELQPQDNFFTLGGDSILAIRLVTLARGQGFALKPADVFDHPTLIGLTRRGEGAATPVIESSKTLGPVPLTPIQRNFFERVGTDQHHYNQTLLVKLAQPLDPTRLQTAFAHLLDHHDVLRFHFPRTETGRSQVAQEHVDVVIDQIQAADRTAVEQTSAEIQASLNLETGPLWRCTLFDTPDGQILLLVFHHLIIDTLSWWFLCEDLLSVYTALSEDRKPRLPLKTTSYADWSQALARHAQSDAVQAEADYWRVLGLGAAPTPAAQSPRSERLLTRELDATVHDGVHAHPNSEALLLAALAKPLTQEFGPVLLDLESHGRHDFAAEVDPTRTQGWFTAVYPIRLDAEGLDVDTLHERITQTPGEGIGYGLLRHLTDAPQLPKAWLRFNYAGAGLDTPPAGLTPLDWDRGPARGAGSGYVLDLQVLHRNERLIFEWRYDPDTLSETQVIAMADVACDTLSNLLEAPVAPTTDLLDAGTLDDVLSAFD